MSRLPPLSEEALSPEQRQLYQAIAGARHGAVGGPFAVWLRLPALADGANRLGNALRLEGHLERRLFELAVLVTARHWGAQYEWFVHEEAARRAGVTEAVIEALRTGARPEFERDDECVVYDVLTALYETHALGQATYARALAALGEAALIELVTAAGFYTTAAMVIQAFDCPVPGNARPLK